jgi:hypothetical protein
MVDKNVVHKNRCGTGETKKKNKKSVSSNSAQAISKHVLVTDDDKSIRDAVTWFLEFMGFEVALATNSISDCFGGRWGGAVVD